MSTRWLSNFQAPFLAITFQTVRLAAFQRSRWLQNSFLNILSHSASCYRLHSVLWTLNSDLDLNFSHLQLWTPNFPPRNSLNWNFSIRSCFSAVPAVVEAQNPVREAKLDARCIFSHLLRVLLKFQYRKKHKYIFLSETSNVKGCFCILSRFYAAFWIQGCFHWLSSPIRSGVMADQRFNSHYSCNLGTSAVKKNYFQGLQLLLKRHYTCICNKLDERCATM